MFPIYVIDKYEAGVGLRGPTAEEMIAGDRKLWDIVADLVNNQKGSLNDALAEVVDVRADMASLLQPRPLPSKSTPPDVPQNYWRRARTGKGKVKGGGKGGGKQPDSVLRAAVWSKMDLHVREQRRATCRVHALLHP